ncbi:MAG: hypothetical protein GY906_24280 [bacterium]|nr:hypothetical protein [bacterium]
MMTDTPWHNDEAYDGWLRVLKEEVIEGDFGYEPGEFTVYHDAWWPLYLEGLNPEAAWQRALNAHKKARQDG